MAEEISFGERLKLERLRLGLTQENLVDEFGKQFPGDQVSRVTISRWENGSHLPSLYNLKHLVIVLGLDQKGIDAFSRAARQPPPETENSLTVAPLDTSNSIAAAPPHIDNLLFQRNPFFTGREEHLERLRKELQETGTAAISQPISISGLAGMGKTELALEYAHRHYPNVYRAALWVNAPDKETLQASYASLAQTLQLEEQNEQELAKRIQAVKNWLKTNTNWLLIMDNADDLSLACSFLPSQPLGHVIFTTRSQIVRDSNIALQINVEELEPDEGRHFLLQRSGKLPDKTKLDAVATDIREAALEVVKLLGGLPLALDQAGAYIEETGVTFADYIQLYQEARHFLLSRRRSANSKYGNHPESVAATVELSFRKACEQHPMAADVLYFCSFCSPDDIPELKVLYGLKLDIKSFNEVIAVLRRHSLIKRHTSNEVIDVLVGQSTIKWHTSYKMLSMHRLVQAVLIEMLSPELRMQWREHVERVEWKISTDLGYALAEFYY